MKNIVVICFLFISTLVQAKTIQVGKEKKYKINSIKAALTIANNNDTIYVNKGIYKEKNISINKSVKIIGCHKPIIDGQSKYEVLSVYANNVTIKGLKIINSGYASLQDPCGIKVYNKAFVTIEDNELDNNFFGIYLQNATHCLVQNNVIIAYGKQEQLIGNGIHCWKCDFLQIKNNIISGHRDGIYFEFVTQSTIYKNRSNKNIRYGLHFMFSNNDAYIANVFKNNGAGVAVMFTKNVKMYYNTFEENWGDSAYGLLLKEISDSYIFNNRFIKNTIGIYMEGTSRIQMRRNRLEANGWAMKIQASCMDNTIKANNFINNTFDISTNGSLVLNKFNSNFWDKYQGYDLNKDGVGDIPYRPLSLFAVLTEKTPSAMLLYRSFMISLLDKSEKIIPTITPDNFIDDLPLMNPFNL